MSTIKNLAERWDEPRGRAFRDACIVIGGSSAARARQWQRHDVLRALYALAGGKADVVVDLEDILSASGMPEGQVMNSINSLEQEGAVQSFNGDCVALLARGITLHERRATRPYRQAFADLGARGGPGLVATVPSSDEPTP